MLITKYSFPCKVSYKGSKNLALLQHLPNFKANYKTRQLQPYFLLLADAQATISGPTEVFVKKGSTISLTCTVNVHSTPPSTTVIWYHGASVVKFDSPRGGVSLETERSEAGTTSKLLITNALISDSGNYTCMPSNASPASAMVHVLNGKLNKGQVTVVCRILIRSSQYVNLRKSLKVYFRTLECR